MDVTLNHAEIETALIGYINDQGIQTQGKSIEIRLTAGRMGSGHTAQLSIIEGDADSAPEATTTVSPFPGGDGDSEPGDSDPIFGT